MGWRSSNYHGRSYAKIGPLIYLNLKTPRKMLNPYFVIAQYLPHQFVIKNSCGEKFYWHREGFSVQLLDQSHYMEYPFQAPSAIVLKKWHALDVQSEKDAWEKLNELAQVTQGIPNNGVMRLTEALNQARCIAFLTHPVRHLENIRAEYRAISLSLFEDSLAVFQSSTFAAKPMGMVTINSAVAHTAFSSKTISQQVEFRLEPFRVQEFFSCQVTPAQFDESGTTWNVTWTVPDYMGLVQKIREIVADFVEMQKAKGRQVDVKLIYY